MASKVVIALTVLVLVSAGVLGALVLINPAPEDTKVSAKFDSPVDGSTVSGVIGINANVTSKKAISYVVLRLDGQTIGNKTVAPFNWELNTTQHAEGQHNLNLTAVNSAGGRGQSQVTVTINNGGTTVGITSPNNMSHVSGDVSVTAQVVSPRTVKYVSFELDGDEVANLSAAPYAVHWNTSTAYNGEHAIQVKAVDILNMSGHATITLIADNPFTYRDARGIDVSFPRIPQRIVTLGNSFTEVVFAVGAGGQLVGRDTKSVYPSEALAVTDVGGTYGTSINMEAIIATIPDLIIAWKYATTASAITTLEADGYKVVALSPSSIDTVKLEIQDIGIIAGHKVEAQKIVQNMTERINRVIEKVPIIPDSQRPKVYFELRNGNTVNNTTMSGEIIRLAGGLNIYGNATKTNPIPSSEVTISRLPAFIVIEDQSIVTNADIEARSGWSIIPAVQQHQIYRINGEWMTATPRLVNAIEQMLQWFYPS